MGVFLGRTGGFALPELPSRSPRARLGHRLLHAVMAGAVVYSTVAGTPPPAAASSANRTATTGAGAAGAAFDPYAAVVAQPVPITIPADAGGPGADPSIVSRFTIPYAATPLTRTELIGERTAYTRTYANPDGSFSRDISQGRLNYLDGTGAWQPLDLSLVTDASDAYNLRVVANGPTVRFGSNDAEAALAQIAAEGYRVSLRALDYDGGTRNENTLAFAGAGSRGIVGVQPTDTGFEFSITLDRPDQATDYDFALDVGQLRAVLATDAQTILLLPPVGAGALAGDDLAEEAVTGFISAPIVFEGEGPGSSKGVSVSLVPAGSTDLPEGVSADAVAKLGPNEVLVSYHLDPVWLHDKTRMFPVVIDPSVCIGGQSGCDNSPISFDEFIFSYNPSYHTSGWTVVRAGWDVRTNDGGQYDAMRGLFYFPDVTLGDGRVLTSATLGLTISAVYGNAVGKPVQVYRVNRAWGTNSVTWNDMTVPTNGWDASPVSPTVNVPSGTNPPMSFTVTDLVRSWYTRRGADWKPDIGLMVRFVTESAATGEASFKKQTDATQSFRPKLTLNYDEPAVAIDFDPTLGNTYAPAAMANGQTTRLPIRITNNASIAYDTTNWKVGYRFFNAKGVLTSSGTQALTSTIGIGATSAINLSVTPPGVGQYTLRLDLVRVASGVNLWASDWATPSAYYSRNKKILTTDSTRWVGSSVIERDEFGISVTNGGGAAGGASGGVGGLSIALGSRNVHSGGETGLGYTDLISPTLRYGYDRAYVADCTGILDACGWFTTWDERITSANYGDSYTYQAPDGNRYLVDNTPDGQFPSGAPILLERRRYTLWDESNPGGWSGGTLPAVSTAFAYSGTHSLAIPASEPSTQSLGQIVDLLHYPKINLWLKSSGTDKAAIGFLLVDNDTGSINWFFYTFGGTSWTIAGYPTKWINTGSSLTGAGGYWLAQQDLGADARAAISGLGKNLAFQRLDLRGSAGATGTLYYDALAFVGQTGTTFNDSQPPWTAGSGYASLNTADKANGTASIQVSPNGNPDCAACLNVDLAQYPFEGWWWKKVGGSTIAHVFHFKDSRTNAVGDITYYAGPHPPSGLSNPVQVSPTLPTDWTYVQRNILEDARQILGFYNDNPTGFDPSAPPSAPVPDPVTVTGWSLVAADGNSALFDYSQRRSATGVGSASAMADDDWTVSYPNLTTHLLNLDGLLERIVDRDGNTLDAVWTYDFTKTGPAAYTLTTLRTPGDGMALSPSGSAQREIAITKTTLTGLTQWTFAEQLGSTGSFSGRRTDFFVATATGTTYGIGDLVAVSPARRNASTNCVGASRPTGCTEFNYSPTSAHALTELRDPRWTGATSGSSDYRLQVLYNGLDPVGIADRSQGSAQIYSVSSYDATPTGAFRRALTQTATERAANAATYADLTPEGSPLATYIAKACAPTGCVYNTSGSYPAAPATTEYLSRSEFDGLARVTTQLAYRSYDSTAGVSEVHVSRRGSNAAAKVDNLIDPLAAAESAWNTAPDQVWAGVRDGGLGDYDRYRTTAAYDDDHQVIRATRLVPNPFANYRTELLGELTDTGDVYWRLNDTGSTAADETGHGFTGTISVTGVTKGVPGGLTGDSNKAMTFNGSTGRITAAVPLTDYQYNYAIEAWVREATDYAGDPNGKGIAGRWAANSGILLYNAGGYLKLVHKNIYIATNFRLEPGVWHHVAVTWDGWDLIVYADGERVGWTETTTSPGLGGTNFEIGAYSNGASTTFNNATIDEVAVSDFLEPFQVRSHYLAGLGAAQVRTSTTYDGEGHPIELVDNYLRDGGFESGALTDWDSHDSSDCTTAQSGQCSEQLDRGATASQTVRLVPGSSIRFQAAGKTDGAGVANWSAAYFRASDATWQTISGFPATSTSTSWTTKAWDLTVPFDSDGRLKISFTNSAASGTNVVWFDDALVVSAWATLSYNTAGQLIDSYLLQPGNAAGATLRTQTTYAASASHPEIFPTKRTVNYVDGTYSDASRDEDVISTSTFDVWGRQLARTDPDGMTTNAVYDPVNRTNLVSSADGLGNTTAFAYDLVGQQLTLTSPLGLVSSTTYDLLGHILTTTAPDGVVAANVYDGYGRRTSSFANYRNGVANDQGGLDDVQTTFTYDAYGRVTTTISDDGYTGGIKAKVATVYDRQGNETSQTAFGDTAYTDARTTTHHWWPYPSTAFGSVEPTAFSGTRLPIAPAGAPAPACPGASAAGYCNQLDTLDFSGQPWLQTDAYGVVTRLDRDLTGHLVRTIANYVAGGGSTASQNVTTSAVFDLAGRPMTTVDPLGRVTRTVYDDVDRPTQVTSQNPAGTDYATSKTVYTAGGRVERTSAPTAAGTADSALTWTKTEYDAAGRAVRTLEHYDSTGVAHYRLDGFETGTDGWSSAASGTFTTAAAASSGLDDEFHLTAPKTGNGRLRVTTAGGSTNSGTWWDLSGQTFSAGHTYRLHIDLLAAAGSSVEALLGVDAAGPNSASSGSVSTTGAWQTIEFTWTPTTTVSANVHAALRKPAAGTLDVYLDNVQVWDTADSGWDIPTVAAYDADGRISASQLPPGHPGEAPLVTTTAYDRLARPLSVSVNAARAYSHLIRADGTTSGLVSDWALDERTGTLADDAQGANDGTFTGPVTTAVAGGVDENRTAIHLDGSAAYVSIPDAAALDFSGGLTIEYWARSDVLLDSSKPAATDFGGISKAGAYGLGWTRNATGGGWRFQITTNSATYIVDAPNTIVEPGRWYHLAGTFNGSVLRLYVDGAEVASNTIGNKTIKNTANPLKLGVYDTAGYWSGDLDEVAVSSSALSGTTITTHETAGRRTTTDTALTTRTTYDVLGRAVAEISPRGIRSISAYDRLGRQTSTTANYRDGVATGAATDDDLTATAAYDAVGELLGTCSGAQVYAGGCDPSSAAEDQAWRYGYDAMGHQSSQVPPVNQSATALSSRSWTYGAGGRLTTICDYPAGGSCASASRHTDATYDPLGRELTRTIYAGAGTGTPKLSWTNTWNADGAQASVAFDGTASNEGTDTLTFTYDGLGRPAQVLRASTVLTDYGWNPDGTLASRVDGTAGTSTFTADWAGRLATMSAPLWSGSLTWAYRLDGLPDWRSWPTGSAGAATYAYDGAKRPTSLTKAGSAAATFSQAYDRDGNVTAEGRSLTGVSGDAGVGSQSFAYDGLARVTGSSGLAATYGYGYDRDGNRTAATVGGATTTYAYDRTGILRTRLDSGVTTYYAADPYGNLTSNAHAVNQVTTNAYDLGDRLTGITLPGGGNTTTTFSFDALGRIATRSGPGAPTETYGYSGTTDTVWQISDGVTTITSGLTADGERVATGSGGLTGFLLADLHGNQGAVVNAAESAIVGATRSDPYGLTAASWSGTGAVPTPWRYQGRLDISANPADPLYVAGARDYLPATGTFLSLDSFAGDIGTPASLNRYLYGNANPTSLIDPSGHVALSGTDPDWTPTWTVAAEQEITAAVVNRILTTYTTDQYLDLGPTARQWVIDAAGAAAWRNVMESSNPWADPFGVILAEDYLLEDPATFLANRALLGARLADTTIEKQDAGRRAHEEGNSFAYQFVIMPGLTGWGDPGEIGSRVGGAPKFGPNSQGPTTAVGRQVHGNSLDSTRPQHLYQITVTHSNGQTEVYKFGVSSSWTRQGLSARAESQVRLLNRNLNGDRYRAEIIGTATNRRSILQMEREYVTDFFHMSGMSPEGNKLPLPYP